MRDVEIYTPEILSSAKVVERFAFGEYKILLRSFECITKEYPDSDPFDFLNRKPVTTLSVRSYIQVDRTVNYKKLRALNKSSNDFNKVKKQFDTLTHQIKDNIKLSIDI